MGGVEEVPRTRRMTLDTGAVSEETVIHQDDETRRLHYRKSAEPDHRGYLASLFVEEAGPAASTVHVVSLFDVLDRSRSDALRARYSAVYDAMFLGWQRWARAGR